MPVDYLVQWRARKRKNMALSCGASLNSVKLGGDYGDTEWSNELDHLPLMQRRKLLLSQNQTKRPPQTEISVKRADEQCNTQNQIPPGEPAEMKGENFDHFQKSLEGGLSGSAGADVHSLELKSDISNNFTDDLDHIILKERQMMLLPRWKMLYLEKPSAETLPLESKSFDRPCCMPTSTDNMLSSVLLNTVKVKDEPVTCEESSDPGRNASVDYCTDFAPVKNEFEFPCEFGNDNLDHMKLQDRMKPHTRELFEVNISGNSESLKIDYSTFEASDPIKIHRPHKRKKTATDSIETALEEDAPGLLRVLMEQGVSVDEIKLYGEAESDELIDESFIEDGFADLEAVMSKLFLHRSSLSKLTLLRCSKGSKPSYCLGCLLSLVEQARYLKFRNWPAEWGWCRDLQSFIFIFEKHKRIVLERPEYGYATYFFELVDSASIGWQVKRLVTTMKLTNCGRITLIENKALLVGEDITEGEAKVLMQFGWIPNSGLGTMLNYCDRVFHDRKHEKDTSEWRSKISKLLLNGYSGGTIVSSNILTEVVDCSSENPQIKVEF